MFTYTMLARSELHDLKVLESSRKHNYLNFPRHGHYTSILFIPTAEDWIKILQTAAFPAREAAGRLLGAGTAGSLGSVQAIHHCGLSTRASYSNSLLPGFHLQKEDTDSSTTQ